MDFNEYQKRALTTTVKYDDEFKGFLNWILGINGEAGEIAEKVKKIIRDKKGHISEQDRVDLAAEIGDVLWYLAVLSDHLGYKFEDIAKANVAKVSSRKARGVICGSGDNR